MDPHVAVATIHQWLQAIPMTAVPEIRKPANDVRLSPADRSAARAVHALETHPSVEFIALAGG